ncbi:hypothetical protein ACIGFL_08440 [Pseudomonas sp. NPDC077649]|uniref:hypothetical protein n=1 Tax=Pseudomonas sp. NPDC077649 TaxID=3364423 RepID=UPI0037C6349E
MFLLIYGYCSLYYIKVRHTLAGSLNVAIIFCQVLSFYILLSSFLKGYGPLEVLSFLVYSGVPVFVSWVVYSSQKDHARGFLIFVFVQVFLAILVLAFPGLEFLDGGKYKALEGVYVLPRDGISLDIPGVSTMKGDVGAYAQFHNPNALGFYSVVSIACGIAILLGRASALKYIAGFVFIILGGMAWLNALTRGPMLLLILAIGVILLFYPIDKHRFGLHLKSLFLLLVATLLVLALMQFQIFAYLVPDSSSVSVSARFIGYARGVEAIFTYPLWGVGMDWEWGELGYPHFISLAFAADFGIFAGVLISLMIFGGGAVVVVELLKKISNRRGEFGSLASGVFLVFIVWGVASTNNIVSPILFWICLAQASLLAFPSQYRR